VLTFGPPSPAGLFSRLLTAAGLRALPVADLRLPLVSGAAGGEPGPPRPELR